MSSLIHPTAALRFLSTVATAQIPLYLAAGPSLDVWTTSEQTEAWFKSILLSKPEAAADTSSHTASHEWWNLARSQSPLGILVQVKHAEELSEGSRVTEVLFYGTIAAPLGGGLPTPPSSSPDAHLPQLRVHALPLSSHLLYKKTNELPNDSEAQFLPPLQTSLHAPRSPKRKRDLFEEATIANRKVRGKGGQGISAAAARGTDQQQPYSHRRSLPNTRASSFSDPRPGSANSVGQHARQLSRSPSITSDLRPPSRKGITDAHSRRSNLSQVATVPLQPEEPTTESRNKEALSKVVMAAMRMHGLQQKKKSRSRRASVAADAGDTQQPREEMTADEIARDDEYKLIYHQTYKSAALALVSP